MTALPPPLRNYINLMLTAKRRLMFIDEFNDLKIDFLKVELIAVQLRKIIEGGCIRLRLRVRTRREKLSEAAINAYDARNVFCELKKKRELNFVPCLVHSR